MKSSDGAVKDVYLLIDSDSLIFGACLRKKEFEDDDGFIRIEEDAEHKFEELVMSMMNHIEEMFNFNIVNYIMFFEGDGNFRYNINKDYKKIRKGKERPPAIPAVKALIKRSQPYFESINCETDDTIINTYFKYRDKYNLIIASPDKDIKTVPTLVYNYHFNHKDLEWVSEEQAKHNKYTQFLLGDEADSIIGIKGIGEKGAEKILSGCKTEYQYLKTVYNIYKNGVPKRTPKSFNGYHSKAQFKFRQNALLLNMGLRSINIPKLENYF